MGLGCSSEPRLTGRGAALQCSREAKARTTKTFGISISPSKLWKVSRASFCVNSWPEGKALMSLFRKNWLG